eukprot:TRINITY_DN1241_c0_g1_i2.p1 TRINITY_DN1241_c0_g1~~TRINITY_DN1241_c0_g1_i2.p1  ORF type:complete len:313 (-),score=-24.59 TRINITY_DN1241_c0_g1_i2:45-947(-)
MLQPYNLFYDKILQTHNNIIQINNNGTLPNELISVIKWLQVHMNQLPWTYCQLLQQCLGLFQQLVWLLICFFAESAGIVASIYSIGSRGLQHELLRCRLVLKTWKKPSLQLFQPKSRLLLNSRFAGWVICSSNHLLKALQEPSKFAVLVGTKFHGTKNSTDVKSAFRAGIRQTEKFCLAQIHPISKCSFNICEKCHIVAGSSNLKYPACSKNHPLLYSKVKGTHVRDKYYSGKYQCAACFDQKYCEAGRYHCAYCLVDVCTRCQIKTELPGIFESVQLVLFPVYSITRPAFNRFSVISIR